MKIVDNRSGEYQVLLREVIVYPFLAPNDDIKFDACISARAVKNFDDVPTGVWVVGINMNVSFGNITVIEDADKIIEALEYARQCANVDLLADASKPLPAQTERDAEAYAEFEAGFKAAGAMDNHDLKMWALNMENVDDKRVLLAIDRLITENATLQAERDALASKLAAAGAERVAALETVYEAVVQCDLQSDMLDAYKAPYDETIHTDNINFDALNEWADLSNALDYLRDNEATPQPAPAPASELVAAVKRVIALAPHNRPEMGDLTTMNNNATQITTIARFESEQAYWRVATILKTALKECGYADNKPL